MTPEEKFWSLVDKDGPIPQHIPHLGKCHVWKGGNFARGYAQFSISGGNHRAARWIFMLKNGVLASNDFVLHLCDNINCVNLEHLRKGSAKDNSDDKVSKGRQSGKLDDSKALYIRTSLANKSETIKSLAKKYGTSFQAVYQVARGNYRKIAGGESLIKKSRVFTPAEIIEIKNCPRTRGAAERLSEKLGVHQSVVCHIRNGKRHRSTNL